jgi:hypothetical protein
MEGLSKTAFWDVDFEKLDYQQHALFIISQVFNYGIWNDQLAVLRYYGVDRVKAEVVKTPYLNKKTLSFLCHIFDLQASDFTCYTRRQSHQLPWEY